MRGFKRIIVLLLVLAIMIQSSFVKAFAVDMPHNVHSYAVMQYNKGKLTLNRKAYGGNYEHLLTSAAGIDCSNPIYAAIYDTLINVKDQIELSPYKPSSADEVISIFDTVMDDHPEISYVSYVYLDSGPNYCTLGINYSMAKDQCLALQKKISDKTVQILNTYINSSMTQLQKEMAIHDYVIQNGTYDIDRYNNNTLTKDDYEVTGILLNGTGVCESYAKTMKYLLNKVGINSIIVSSEAMNHAWNIVNINGKNYHVDATWDDPVAETNRVNYQYFNIPDSVMSDNTHRHVWDTSKYPACIDNSYSYLQDLSSEAYYTRKDSIIYYFDINAKTLNSMNVDGTGKKFITNLYGFYPVIYGDYIYYVYNGVNIYKIKIGDTSGQLVASPQTDNILMDLYIKQGILHVKTDYRDMTKEFTLDLSRKEDVNKDGNIDIKDLALLSQNYNKRKSTSWDDNLDIVNDGIIDIFDLVKLSKTILL